MRLLIKQNINKPFTKTTHSPIKNALSNLSNFDLRLILSNLQQLSL